MTPSIKIPKQSEDCAGVVHIPREVAKKAHKALKTCYSPDGWDQCFDEDEVKQALALLAPYLKGDE